MDLIIENNRSQFKSQASRKNSFVNGGLIMSLTKDLKMTKMPFVQQIRNKLSTSFTVEIKASKIILGPPLLYVKQRQFPRQSREPIVGVEAKPFIDKTFHD